MAKQPADGNTLLMAHINSQAITPALVKLNYDPEKDFQPIVLVGVTPNLLICNEQQPAKTVKDIVELCRKNPGKMSFGSAGNGSAQHLALEMFMLAAKVKAIHVPYKGSGPMLTDLIGGTDPVQLRHDDGRHAAREERQGHRDRADPPGARQGLSQRADDGRVRLPRLRGHHLVRPRGPGQDAAGHGQAHERGRQQGPARCPT